MLFLPPPMALAPQGGGGTLSSGMDGPSTEAIEAGADDSVDEVLERACAVGSHRCANACVPNDDVKTCGAFSCEPCPVPSGGIATCSGTVCGGACLPGQKLCSGACIPVEVGCVGSCPEGTHECDGTCQSNTSLNSCGNSCVPCPAPENSTPECNLGVCSFNCVSGSHRCDGICVEDHSTLGCGTSCTPCPFTSGATTTCDGTSCGITCNSPAFFADETGCHAKAVQVSANLSHTCALLFDGTVRCWGSSSVGQLGDGRIGASSLTPVVVDIDSVEYIGVGDRFTCALREDQSVWCWGANDFGQLGRGTVSAPNMGELIPTPVVGINDAQELSVGRSHACVIRALGVSCWGQNSSGEMGLGTLSAAEPLAVTANVGPTIQLSAGSQSTCARLAANGVVQCWGGNSNVVLGSGEIFDGGRGPFDVQGVGGDARMVITSGGHGCVVREGGTARCWGQNASGEVGDGTTESRSEAVAVVGVSAISSIAVGLGVTCAVLSGGVASCWGANDHGQLGSGSVFDFSVQGLPVGALREVQQLAVSAQHVCALLADGSVWCWGSNISGQLGNRTPGSALPTRVVGW